MLLAQNVMKTHITTVRPMQGCHEVGTMLLAEGISGAPVVDAWGKAVGVITLSDLLSHSLGLHRQRPTRSLSDLQEPPNRVEALDEYDVPVSEIMTKFLVRVDVATPVTEVIALIVETGIHRIFVTREEKLCGVISSLDLAEILGQVLESQKGALPLLNHTENLM